MVTRLYIKATHTNRRKVARPMVAWPYNTATQIDRTRVGHAFGPQPLYESCKYKADQYTRLMVARPHITATNKGE